jgi:hypothetical protein
MRYQQLQLFTRPVTAALRDRTKRRNYSPEMDEFRLEHARRRRWGLKQRHAQKLCLSQGCSRECAEVGLHDDAEVIPPLIWPAGATVTRRPSPAVPSGDVPAERDLPAVHGPPAGPAGPAGPARPAGPAGGIRCSERLGLAARIVAGKRAAIRAPPAEQTSLLGGTVTAGSSPWSGLFPPATGISLGRRTPTARYPTLRAGHAPARDPPALSAHPVGDVGLRPYPGPAASPVPPATVDPRQQPHRGRHPAGTGGHNPHREHLTVISERRPKGQPRSTPYQPALPSPKRPKAGLRRHGESQKGIRRRRSVIRERGEHIRRPRQNPPASMSGTH